MKITKSQLKQLIKEELEEVAGQHQETNLDDDLIEKAIWYYKNQRGGGLKDLKIIASGQPMPDVVSIGRPEAEKIVLIARALEMAGVATED